MEAAKKDPRQCTFHWIPAWALTSAGGPSKSVKKKVLFPLEELLVVLVAMLIAIESQGVFPSWGCVDQPDVDSLNVKRDLDLKFGKEITDPPH